MEPDDEVVGLPQLRAVFTDLRGSDRALRVSAHPDQDLVVLSIWRADRCVATVRLAAAELPDLVGVLAEMEPLRSIEPDRAVPA